MTTISVDQQNAHADLAADATDGGGAAGYVELYTGGKPATVATAATGTLLVTITFNLPAYGDAGATTAGTADLDLDPAVSGMPVAEGTPGWCRVYTSAGTALRDNPLTGAPATVIGQPYEFATGTLMMPENSA